MKRIIRILVVGLLLSGLTGTKARAATTDAVVGTGTPASCDETAFDAALATVQAGTRGTITFDCGPASHTIEIYNSATISKEVTIDGGGLIRLFAQGSSPMFVKPRFFEVSAGGWLTLNDMVLEGGRGPAGDGWGSQGGSIVVWGAGQLDMQGTTILNSASTAWGGAIANEGGVVRVQDSIISGSSAKWGGAYNGANGYDIFINATVVGSISAEGGGGVRLWNTIDSSITDSTISGHTTAGSGGGIENIGGQVTIRGSYIEGNAATLWGGGVKNSNNGDRTGWILIENSRIADNVSGINGGGIESQGSLTLRTTRVTDNTAVAGGGILSWDGQLTIDGTSVVENSADKGGGIYAHGGGVVIDNSQVADNVATEGGGLYLTEIAGAGANNWAHITASDITGNRANSGSGILAAHAYVTVSQSEIFGNGALAVYLWQTVSGGSYMVVTQSSIHDNTGSGFYNGENSTLTIGNSTISQNGEWGVWAGQNSIQTLLGFSTVRDNAAGQIRRTGGQLVLEASAIDRGTTATPNCVTDAGLPAPQGGGNMANDNSCGAPVTPNSDLDLGPLELNGRATPGHWPQPGSALIDAAACGIYKTDQHGMARPQGTACDVGAVEVGPDGGRIFVPAIMR